MTYSVLINHSNWAELLNYIEKSATDQFRLVYHISIILSTYLQLGHGKRR